MLDAYHWLNSQSLSIAAALFALLILVNIITLWQVRAYRRRVRVFETLFKDYCGPGIEDVLEEIRRLEHENRRQIHRLEERVESIEGRLPAMLSTLRVIRYKAFPEVGGDLSFSLALLSERGDGAVITGLHGREYSMVWAKPVQAFSSSYQLSEEEQAVLRMAQNRG
ncbi:MAG TPA: DUF4446 family protein [Syntrophothermus lipocalidus]|uniref:DUF4446 domain-containing protein n=1 Tax=Syntrophothermus lipocalidus (strain DSM 12680 / TGB-C1) TaxID=643648 RepID=D7CKC5_SYNLT|nr:DUF4446 family protein [Syntrophothermus lipocalidus]ADI03109.1 conserved hypothetical protein [Syntrophothermus lipocalidus DSM 12680]HHV76621.1 DUF4446 family protein [Syntrophothermus lipocalidus]